MLEGETKFDVFAGHVTENNVSSSGGRYVAISVTKHRDGNLSRDNVDRYLSAKNKIELADHGDDTNFNRRTPKLRRLSTHYKTTPESRSVGGCISTRYDMAGGSWLAILVTASKGSLYQRGRSSQSRRGEQKVAEKGELGHHGGDDGAVNRGCNESLRQREYLPTFIRSAYSH